MFLTPKATISFFSFTSPYLFSSEYKTVLIKINSRTIKVNSFGETTMGYIKNKKVIENIEIIMNI